MNKKSVRVILKLVKFLGNNLLRLKFNIFIELKIHNSIKITIASPNNTNQAGIDSLQRHILAF